MAQETFCVVSFKPVWPFLLTKGLTILNDNHHLSLFAYLNDILEHSIQYVS